MDNLKAIVVDDEEGAHLVLSHYLANVKMLTLAGSFYNAIEAMEYIYRHKVDIIFLDINMPGLSGMEMLETMSTRPHVILTTAYKEYALEGYQYEVVDYLVKPFDFKKFLSAIDKVLNRINLHRDKAISRSSADHLILKVNGDLIKIDFADILYLQSYGNYVKVFVQDGMYLCQSTTAEIEEKLPPHLFLRIHKSFIVSLGYIEKMSATHVWLGGSIQLPVGNTFKRKLQDYFGKKDYK
ncbi:LytTR family DNA-binding domain-containing protein [Chitinophaga sp. 212800010-3]|uniref:LytR/AlgR family response regulator transcription factor n=1 Tax=unclassified Chitinophaga TaxID=2619133 RepID=UPI002DEF21D0|nr:DNA-binding response regulator [Chitinophaga sp. 212800010-3]